MSCYLLPEVTSIQVCILILLLHGADAQSFSCNASFSESLHPGTIASCNCTITSIDSFTRWNFTDQANCTTPYNGSNFIRLFYLDDPSNGTGTCGPYLSAACTNASSCSTSILTITVDTSLDGLGIACLDIKGNATIGQVTMRVTAAVTTGSVVTSSAEPTQPSVVTSSAEPTQPSASIQPGVVNASTAHIIVITAAGGGVAAIILVTILVVVLVLAFKFRRRNNCYRPQAKGREEGADGNGILLNTVGPPMGIKVVADGADDGTVAEGDGPKDGTVAEGDGPKVEGDGPKVEGDGPKVEGDGPKVEGDGPKVEGDGPKVDGDGPKVEGDGPKDGTVAEGDRAGDVIGRESESRDSNSTNSNTARKRRTRKAK